MSNYTLSDQIVRDAHWDPSWPKFNSKEHRAQKALGTFPKKICSSCKTEVDADEIRFYQLRGYPGFNGCGICILAKFVADWMLSDELKPLREEYTKCQT